MSSSTNMNSQIDPQYTYQIESIYKSGRYVNTEGYHTFNHNVAVHDKTGKRDQDFLFIPSSVPGHFRLISLREDVGARYFVSIGSNANIVTWHNAGDDTQSFKAVQLSNGNVAFTADNSAHFLNVAGNGNIHSYMATNGRPKESQLFRLRKGRKWSLPIEVPNELNELRKHRNQLDGLMATLCGHYVEPRVAGEMNKKITSEIWLKMISAFKKVEQGTEDEKSNVIRDILMTIGFTGAMLASVLIAVLVVLVAIAAAPLIAPMLYLIVVSVIFLLSLFVAIGSYALTLMWIWWKDVSTQKLIQLSV